LKLYDNIANNTTAIRR